MKSLKLIEEAKKFGLVACEQTVKNGHSCAKIRAKNPVTGGKINRNPTAENDEVLREKIARSEKEIYDSYRPDFLCVLLQRKPELLLKDYLELDLEFWASTWPVSYKGRDYEILLRFAEEFKRDLGDCKTADDFLSVVALLEIDRGRELILLRMLGDIMSTLVGIGLCSGPNPLEKYYEQARQAENKKRKDEKMSLYRALTDFEINALMLKCNMNLSRDHRYHAILLSMLSVSAEQIAALNFEDVVVIDGVLSLQVRYQMKKGQKRYQREAIGNEWKVRSLTVPWMQSYVEQRQKSYAEAGICNVPRIPLFTSGAGKSTKRLKPDEIEEFIKDVLVRVSTPSTPDLRPVSKMGIQTFRERATKVSIASLRKSFRVFGEGEQVLTQKIFLTRYILGEKAKTVDEYVYLDYVHPFSQNAMAQMIQGVFCLMGLEI